MATIARRNVIVEFNADTSQLNRATQQAERQVSGLQNVLQNAAGTFAGLFAFDLAGRITSVAQSTLNLAISAEQTQVAFETLAGSAEAANKILAELREFSTLTPFEPDEIINAGKTLLALGTSTDKVTGILKQLGDVSSGLNLDINELAVLFGRASSAGTLLTEDLNQLQDRGIPVFKELAKQFGITGDNATAAVKKLASEGEISFSNLEKVFQSLTSEGGQFFDLTAKQSLTLGGRISTLKGKFDDFLREIGESLLPTLKSLTEVFINLFSVLKPEIIIRFTKVIAAAVAAVVSYNVATKAAAFLTNAYKAAAALASAATAAFRGNTIRAAAAMRLFNRAVRNNPIGLLTAALGAAATAYGIFGGAASNAADSQDEFNESVSEGNRLLGAVEDIEFRANSLAKLSKEQAQKLKEDIDNELKANTAKEAQLLAISESFRQQREAALKIEEDKRTAGDRDIIENAQKIAELVQKQAEGITETEVNENEKRLQAARAATLERIKFLEGQENQLTDKQKKALEKRQQEQQKLIDKFNEQVAKDNEELTDELNLTNKEFIDEQERLRDEQIDKEAERNRERLELEKEFLREKLKLDEESFKEEERIRDTRIKNRETELQIDNAAAEQALNERIANENLSADQINRLREQLAKDNLKREIEALKDKLKIDGLEVDQETALNQELAQKQAELSQQEGEERREGIKAITEASIEGINTVLEAARDAQRQRIELLKEDIDEQKERVADALKIAEEGNTELLEAEERRLNDLQKKKEEAQRKEAILAAAQIALNQAVAISQTIVAVSKAFAENIFVGIATSIALAAQTAAAVISTRQAFANIQGFAEGTEFFDGVGGPKSDSNLAFISRGERIVPADKNNKYFSTLNEFQKGTPMADMLHNIAQGAIPVAAASDRQQGRSYDMGRIEKEMKMMNKNFSKLQMNVKLDKDGFHAHMQRYGRKRDSQRKRLN